MMKLFRPEKIVYETRKPGLIVQVVERGMRRELRFGNSIVQSAHSLTAPDTLQLDYTRAMMAGFLLAPQARRLLHIGLGGGSLPRFVHVHVPEAEQDVVELSPDVAEACYRFFELPKSPRLRVHLMDGAEFLAENREKYDMILLDAFKASGAEGHLNTREQYQRIAGFLAPGGWLVNNVWGSDRENLMRVRQDMNRVFPHLYSVSVRADSNVIMLGGQDGRTPTVSQMRRRAMAMSRIFPLDFIGLLHQLKQINLYGGEGAASGMVQ